MGGRLVAGDRGPGRPGLLPREDQHLVGDGDPPAGGRRPGPGRAGLAVLPEDLAGVRVPDLPVPAPAPGQLRALAAAPVAGHDLLVRPAEAHRALGDARGERDPGGRRAAGGRRGLQRPVDADEPGGDRRGHGQPGADVELEAGDPAAQHHPDRPGQQHPADHGDGLVLPRVRGRGGQQVRPRRGRLADDADGDGPGRAGAGDHVLAGRRVGGGGPPGRWSPAPAGGPPVPRGPPPGADHDGARLGLGAPPGADDPPRGRRGGDAPDRSRAALRTSSRPTPTTRC